MPEGLQPILPFIVSLGALIFIEFVLSWFFVNLVYRLTHRGYFSIYFYVLMMWPGTVVHEFSHWFMAKILRVPVGLPHLLPSGIDHKGRIILGYVKRAQTDILRGSLIGAAPFIFGSMVVAVLTRYLFDLPRPDLQKEGLVSLIPLVEAFPTIFDVPYPWAKLYLIFAIANGIMPSESDRRDWPSLLFFIVFLAALLFFLFGIPEIPYLITEWGIEGLTWLTFALVITIVLDFGLLLIIAPLERFLWSLGR